MTLTRSVLLLLVLGMVPVSACSKKKAVTTPPTGPIAARVERPVQPATPSSQPAGAEVRIDTPGAAPTFDPIYFETDSAQLRPESRDVLASIADYLKRTPAATLTVAGHCDERGSTEYNVALGEQRAVVARDYLVRLGVSAGRLRVISYGEERPAVAGDGEDAWARNRRSEWELEGAPRANP